jgi:hypothetical protein
VRYILSLSSLLEVNYKGIPTFVYLLYSKESTDVNKNPVILHNHRRFIAQIDEPVPKSGTAFNYNSSPIFS